MRFMVLEGTDLSDFSLSKFRSERRNKLKKAVRECLVRPIDNLEARLEEMRQINISQSLRQAAKHGAETPSGRYINGAEAWRTQIRREFSLPGREWWGSFVGGSLVAYMTTYEVEKVRIIEKTKSHTAALAHRPVDALYLTVISAAAAAGTCDRILNGSPQHVSLDRYKEEFCFKAVEYPYHSSHATWIEFAKRWTLATP